MLILHIVQCIYTYVPYKAMTTGAGVSLWAVRLPREQHRTREALKRIRRLHLHGWIVESTTPHDEASASVASRLRAPLYLACRFFPGTGRALVM